MLIERHVQENMHKTKNQTEFWQRYEEIEKRTNDLAAELGTIKLSKLQRMQKAEMIDTYKKTVEIMMRRKAFIVMALVIERIENVLAKACLSSDTLSKIAPKTRFYPSDTQKSGL